MIEFHQESNTQQRVVGGVAAFLYLVLLLVLFLLVKFRIEIPSEGEGLMINFGNVAEAAPGEDLPANDQMAEAPRQEQPSQRQDAEPEEQMTQEIDEEAPVIEQKKVEKKPKKEQKQDTPKPQQKPAEKPREVNRKALFPGRTEGSASTSEGTGTGAGNQGDPAGSPEGSHEGTGTGTSGVSANLTGRSVIEESLIKPAYSAREQGRVIIDIIVDQQGKVTWADFRPKGSTINNSSLVNSARQSALKARFNVDENAPLSQKGSITYNFRMQ